MRLRFIFLWIIFLGISIVAFQRCKVSNAREQNNLKKSSTFTGRVTAIKDGDTYKVLVDTGECTIRLAHIDCPEKKQPFGTRAKQYASDLCFGKVVTIKGDGKKDRNGRLIAEVYTDNICVNKELVIAGLAWHFKRYSDDSEYARLETIARNKKTGLWSDPRAIAPWEWRKPKTSLSR